MDFCCGVNGQVLNNLIGLVMYIVHLQGCWEECQSDSEAYSTTRDNVLLLYSRVRYYVLQYKNEAKPQLVITSNNLILKTSVLIYDFKGFCSVGPMIILDIFFRLFC